MPTAPTCTSQPAYTEVPLAPANAVEAALLPSLRVCVRPLGTVASGQQQFGLEVRNAGPGVWVINGAPSWDDAARGSGPVAVQLFRDATAGSAGGLAVEPGQSAYLTVPASYDLELHIDAGLQAEWVLISQTVQRAVDRGVAAATRRLTPGAQALITCGQSAYAVGNELRDLDADTSSEDLVQKVLDGASSTRTCTTALEEASRQARAEGRAALTVQDLRPERLVARAAVELDGFGLRGAAGLARYAARIHL